jgi:hypothetical protein
MKTKTNINKQREDWLNRATALFTKHWATMAVVVPADVQLSCGFPGGGSVYRRIGECWPRARSEKKVNQIFISPVIAQPTRALDILGHELLHAVDDCASGHGQVFTKNSGRVGYSGGKHSTAETPQAKAHLVLMAKLLGKYPHGAVVLKQKKAKESSGLHKFECEEHGDVIYSTAKKVDEFGAPRCRECNAEMTPAERKEKKVITTI